MNLDDASGRTLRSTLFLALRTLFRALPMGEATRDAWRQRFLERFPTIRPITPQGQQAPALERRPRVHAGGRAIGYVERTDEPLPEPLPATLVAFYLPQFHTIPENDQWWGKGFTEWRNVARALPQFEGHAQPRLPGDLGFYDLRNPQVLRDQAELAQAYGIGAFCMYFYWFGGKTLLELPHQQWLDDPSITLPICLCWANENWTRTWDGRAEDVLIAQEHSPEDDLAFIAHVARYLRDPRYLRVDGKPLLLVYRPGKLPDPNATADRWRAWCRENGVGELCIGYVQSFERPDPRDIGFDVAVEFPPNLSTPTNITGQQVLLNPDYEGEVLDWRDVARDYSRHPMPEYRLFPGVNCGWDNEPRRPGRGRTVLHATPRAFGHWLSRTIHERLADIPPPSRMVFINAWNEWAEGAVLEPDARLGHALLDSVRQALSCGLQAAMAGGSPLPMKLNVLIHAWYPDILDAILTRLAQVEANYRIHITTCPERLAGIKGVVQRHGLQVEYHVAVNQGRDILPFLQWLARQPLEETSLILKLHTKLSPHRTDGVAWRDQLLEPLLCPERFFQTVNAFQHDPSLGMVGPDHHHLALDQFIGANARHIANLARRMDIPDMAGLDPASSGFISGSMFWVRASALEPLVALDLDSEDFETELGQLDGTLAHAVERVLALAVGKAGYSVTTVSGAAQGQLAAPGQTPYQFALRH